MIKHQKSGGSGVLNTTVSLEACCFLWKTWRSFVSLPVLSRAVPSLQTWSSSTLTQTSGLQSCRVKRRPSCHSGVLFSFLVFNEIKSECHFGVHFFP